MKEESKIRYFRSKSGRYHYMIDHDVLTTVMNKHNASSIKVEDNWIMVCSVVQDAELYKPCTEEEFKKAYADALVICSTMKIV